MPKHTRDAAGHETVAVHVAHTPILAALVTCPALVIPFSENPFEPHKAAFLWTMSAAACAAIIGSAAASRLATALDGWARLMAICAGIAIVAMLVSTALSEAPQLAWWGSALRAQGTFTALSTLLVLVAILIVASPAFVEQLTSVVIIGSVGPTVYAIGQVLGVDPLKADANLLDRASSTLGNPLFFAGYLVTVWPLTLGRAIITSRAVAHDGASRAATAGLWVLFGLQSAAVLAARARGPILALLVAATIGGMLAVTALGWSRLARILAGITLAAAVCFVIITPAWMRAPDGRVTVDEMGQRTAGTGTVRLILWEAIARGVSANGGQMVFGSGPESTTGLMSRFAGPELRGLEGPDTAPDRAHNDTLDRLASFGAIGVALHLAMSGITLVAALSGLSLLARARTRTFALFAVIVLIASSAAATGTGRGLWALAVVTPAAAVIVISGWIAWHPGSEESGPQSARWDVAVAIGAATVAWIAHLVEVALSIDTVASSLNAVAAVAIVVALGVRARDRSAPLKPAPARAAGGPDEAMAILAGWSVAVLTIALSGPMRNAGFSVWAIAATTWALALAIVGVNTGRIVRSVSAWLTVVFVWLLWSDSPGATVSSVAAAAVAGRLPLFYVLAGLCLVTTAVVRQRRWSSAIAVAVIAGAIVGGYAIRVTSADVLMFTAARLRASDSAAAIALYRQAGERNPSNAGAFTQLADALMIQADAAAEAPRNALFKDASDALARARGADPFEYHHPRNLAALQRRWARMSAPSERRAHQEEADRYYRAAADLAPGSGVLLAEWANLDAERGDMSAALARLDRAASLGAEKEAAAICDAIMRAERQDISNPDALRHASLALKDRGYPALASMYARRAAR